METVRCSGRLGAEHRCRGCTEVCPAYCQWWQPAVVMDGNWIAAANRLAHDAQLAVCSEPGQPTIRCSGCGKQVLPNRSISGSLSLREETGSFPGLFF